MALLTGVKMEKGMDGDIRGPFAPQASGFIKIFRQKIIAVGILHSKAYICLLKES